MAILLICCCCGGLTRGKQWHNRDKGYGLCSKCAKWLKTRETPEEMTENYGVEGINYPQNDETFYPVNPSLIRNNPRRG